MRVYQQKNFCVLTHFHHTNAPQTPTLFLRELLCSVTGLLDVIPNPWGHSLSYMPFLIQKKTYGFHAVMDFIGRVMSDSSIDNIR